MCTRILFFRGLHFIHSSHIYEHLVYPEPCVGHWVYNNTVLTQRIPNITERWIYVIIIKSHRTMEGNGEMTMESFTDGGVGKKGAHTDRTLTILLGLRE